MNKIWEALGYIFALLMLIIVVFSLSVFFIDTTTSINSFAFGDRLKKCEDGQIFFRLEDDRKSLPKWYKTNIKCEEL